MIGDEKFDKVVPYIIKGRHQYEDVGSHRLQITATKQEDAFTKFGTKDSSLVKLCKIAARDPIVRTLFFLRSTVSRQPDPNYPVVLTVPFLIEADETLLKSITDGSGSVGERVSELKESSERLKQESADVSTRSMGRFYQIFSSDPEFRQMARSGRLRPADRTMYERIHSRNKKEMDAMMTDFMDLLSRFYQVAEHYGPLTEAVEKLGEAELNMKCLLEVANREDLASQLSHSLGQLMTERLFRSRTESLCLECTLRRGIEAYRVIRRFSATPEFEKDCDKCGGKTMFNKMILEGPAYWGPLLSEHRLAEFVIGYSLAFSECIKKIYIHKKVNVVTDQVSKGTRVDILAFTNDDRILAAEVTISTDLNKIMENLIKRKKALAELPIDAIAQITPCPTIERYFRSDNALVTGIRQLSKIHSHVDYFLQGTSPNA